MKAFVIIGIVALMLVSAAFAEEAQVGVGADVALGTQDQVQAQAQVQAQDQVQEPDQMQDKDQMQEKDQDRNRTMDPEQDMDKIQAKDQDRIHIDADQIKQRLQDMNWTDEQDRDRTKDQNKTMDQNMTHRIIFETGLNMAASQVQNEQAKMAIEQNMERFMERYQDRLQNMEFENVSVNATSGEVQVMAQEQVRFFGFIKGKVSTDINVDSNGNVEEHAPWYRFLYSKA